MTPSPPRLAKLASRFLGLFLPPDVRRTPVQSRSLIAVGTILLATVFEIGNVTNFYFVPPTPVILWSNLGLLLISVLSLLAIRIGFEPGKVVPFFSSGYILVLAYVSSMCQCFMAPGMYYYPVFLMFGSLLSRSRWANIQSVTAIVATLYVFSQTSAYGLAIPWGWDVDVFLRRMSVVTIIMCVVSFLTMALQDYYRKQTMQEISSEREWLFRSSRLFEVSTLSGSLYSRLTVPVLELGHEITRLKSFEPSGTHQDLSVQHLKDIARAVENLAKISRSIHLIHSAGGRRLRATTTLSRLFEHMNFLLRDKASEEGWELRFETDAAGESGPGQQGRDLAIEGAVSSLSILLSSLALRNIEIYLSTSLSILTIKPLFAVDTDDKRISWSMSWPKVRLKSSLVPDLVEQEHSLLSIGLHEKFIQDLLDECGGELIRKTHLHTHEIILRGDWFRI